MKILSINKSVKKDFLQTIIFHYDFGLDWYLKEKGYQIFNAFIPADSDGVAMVMANAREDNWKQTYENSIADCKIYLSTFVGSMEKTTKESLDDFFLNNERHVKRISIKKDKYANFKRILEKKIPDYYVEFILLRE